MSDDATSLAEAIRKGRLTASEAMRAAIEHAESRADLGAIVHLDPDLGLEAAAALDVRMRQSADRLASLPFAGVPSLAKDLGGPFAGLPVAVGSRMLDRAEQTNRDSDLAARMHATGLCFFGLTTVPEMGLSLSSEPASGPVCRNPLDLARTPGGSSGGAAAAVAAGIVTIAHATDAGGSIRVPAACCGLFGMKPTRGAIPAGPGFGNHLGGIVGELAVCRSTRDLTAIFEAVQGNARGPFADPGLSPAGSGLLRIGLLADTGLDHPTDGSRSEAVEAAARVLEAGGHTVVSLDWTAFAVPVAASGRALRDIIAVNLANYVGDAGLDAARAEPLTQAFIRLGASMAGRDLWHSLDGGVNASRAIWNVFEDVDVLLTPMLSSAPVPLGSFPFDHGDPELQIRRMADFAPLAALANVTGFPALTLPFGTDADGLPLPVQLIAPMGNDRLLLRIAGLLEQEGRWQHRHPVAGLAS